MSWGSLDVPNATYGEDGDSVGVLAAAGWGDSAARSTSEAGSSPLLVQIVRVSVAPSIADVCCQHLPHVGQMVFLSE